MRARTLAIAALMVAGFGFLAYSCSSRTDGADGADGPRHSLVSAAPSASTAPTPAPPVDPAAAKPPAASRAAEEAARQGLTVVFTWYPATDATQQDAYGRARNWLTGKLADRMIIAAATERGPGVQWSQWAQQGAKVIADVSIGCSGCPDDTDTTVSRVATVTQTAVTADGTDTVKPDTTVWVTVVREGDRWLIDDIRY
ncbi:hypothetical protein GCM10023094_55090 [Rhodococcus olei]|uniref:Mce-associated membrane protein n=1 Tax=Rhodococcus olei TaxID=2161675 RepID=A0ABP8PRP2_9NOCA